MKKCYETNVGIYMCVYIHIYVFVTDKINMNQPKATKPYYTPVKRLTRDTDNLN